MITHDLASASDPKNFTLPYSNDLEGNQVLQDFEVKEIMVSPDNAIGYMVVYLIIQKGYLEESEWTLAPIQHLPHTLVHAFHARYPGAAMDARLRSHTRRP